MACIEMKQSAGTIGKVVNYLNTKNLYSQDDWSSAGRRMKAL